MKSFEILSYTQVVLEFQIHGRKTILQTMSIVTL